MIDESIVVLSYDDITLFECDVKSVSERHEWLTDNFINFGAAYLKNSIIKNKFDEKVRFNKNVCLFRNRKQIQLIFCIK